MTAAQHDAANPTLSEAALGGAATAASTRSDSGRASSTRTPPAFASLSTAVIQESAGYRPPSPTTGPYPVGSWSTRVTIQTIRIGDAVYVRPVTTAIPRGLNPADGTRQEA